jgi:hypothetical protein
MKHHLNISRKTMLTFYLSLSTLFMFVMFLIMFIPVETNVNVTVVTDIITISSNSTKTPPTDDETSSPYNERVIVILGYFGLSLIVCIPVLMCILCFYKMKGSAPCNFREAFCSCC